MISNPTSKGKTGEAVILATLVRLGKSVLISWGEPRNDLAVDEGGKLVRIRQGTLPGMCGGSRLRDRLWVALRNSPSGDRAADGQVAPHQAAQ